ncbi:hypothetical protein M3919_003899 [Vibrio parahaemolyticus]|nr:hypothetical protein [Vibrio parahaemolyticus]EJE4158663.1 hypothetical protein [Vibrio parahaemolyticus]
MADINQEIDRGIELLWLCQSLQSEKDGVKRPSHFQIDKSKTLDSFAQDISRAVTNMSCHRVTLTLMLRLLILNQNFRGI